MVERGCLFSLQSAFEKIFTSVNRRQRFIFENLHFLCITIPSFLNQGSTFRIQLTKFQNLIRKWWVMNNILYLLTWGTAEVYSKVNIKRVRLFVRVFMEGIFIQSDETEGIKNNIVKPWWCLYETIYLSEWVRVNRIKMSISQTQIQNNGLVLRCENPIISSLFHLAWNLEKKYMII